MQSLPVLAFMPGLVLGLVSIFPSSNIGLELAAVVMIFTGQAWNMTFSFYHSLRSVPPAYGEVASVYRFDGWQRFRWLELPFATIGLVWNSMMSMAGGWFFLMINEAFRLGDKDFRLPGVGSYMSVAVERGRIDSMLWAMCSMIWRGQLLKLGIFREIHNTLQRQPEHALERDFVLETIIMRMPQENYENVFSTFIRWARFGDLFSYDETTEVISLQ